MPSPVPYREIKQLIEQHGYVLRRVAGSHHIFKKDGAPRINFPVHKGLVKHAYFRQILKILGIK